MIDWLQKQGGFTANGKIYLFFKTLLNYLITFENFINENDFYITIIENILYTNIK